MIIHISNNNINLTLLCPRDNAKVLCTPQQGYYEEGFNISAISLQFNLLCLGSEGTGQAPDSAPRDSPAGVNQQLNLPDQANASPGIRFLICTTCFLPILSCVRMIMSRYSVLPNRVTM